jgi:dTDP-4-dehydrorhamnose reductase
MQFTLKTKKISMHNILVTGATGQLGSEIKAISTAFPNYEFFFCSSSDLNICNHASVREYLETNTINFIINCAAYTAVDKAETDVETAYAVNHLAVENLALLAAEKNIQMIHISTDYVFDGTNHRPYLESDKPNPQSVYGSSKLAGEEAMCLANPKNSTIIRTSWVYSQFGNNFVKTMLRLAKERNELNVVADQIGSPTNARDLALAIFKILPQLNNDDVELLHYSNDGMCSWYDFAHFIFEKPNVHIKLNPITTEQYPTPAQRPHFSVLSKEKIRSKYAIEAKHWATSLEDYLAERI